MSCILCLGVKSMAVEIMNWSHTCPRYAGDSREGFGDACGPAAERTILGHTWRIAEMNAHNLRCN